MPLDPSRPPQRNAPTMRSITYLITVLHTPPMELSNDPATWFCVHIMTQFFTMKAKDAAEQGLTLPFQKRCYALMEGLRSHACPNHQISHVFCFQSRTWGNFHNSSRDGGNKKHTGGDEMSQPKSPIQIDNSAAAGFVNNTLVPRKLKTMDRRLHWLRCREDQGQIRYYCASGNLNGGGLQH